MDRGAPRSHGGPIDRRAVVSRHDVELTAPDPHAPLTVGNGDVAFTAGVTGLQTFPGYYEAGVPLHTQSHWGWHRMPNPEGYALADTFEHYEVDGRQVPYAGEMRTDAARWLRSNPHRLDLGRLGMCLEGAGGGEPSVDDLGGIDQRLDLWAGRIESEFSLDGRPVAVTTAVHPEHDAVAARIASPLLADERLGIELSFPYGAADWREPADWSVPERHETAFTAGDGAASFDRTLDGTEYTARLAHSAGTVEPAGDDPHSFRLSAPGTEELEVVLGFAPGGLDALPSFDATLEAAASEWEAFWTGGGAIDLSGSDDPRWRELERRVVLSQYATAVNCAGEYPPAETGLVTNSWFGKFHLEMHWWHGVHFALWDRIGRLERSLPYYEAILDRARAKAERQGYDGARWPKMTDPEGRESPSGVGVFLVWQQPHPIYYAELAYRERGAAALDRYGELVAETAAFMADYPTWDGERYVLGPPLIPAQERGGDLKERITNPPFELAYWHWGLETAQRWRERAGRGRDPEWDHVLDHLSAPPVHDGAYASFEPEPHRFHEDHPSMCATLGMLPPTPSIDEATMDRTLDHVLEVWDWSTTWGWDYPVLAMTAARLGRPGDAVDALLMDAQRNRYLPNGYNYQEGRLPVYLPGNGGLLTAVAMMAAGWEDGPDEPAPGFPEGWTVAYENLWPLL